MTDHNKMVVDMHCDTISALYWKRKKGCVEHLSSNSLSVDLHKMQAGGYALQNFAVFVDMERVDDPLDTALGMISLYHQEVGLCHGEIATALSWADICRNQEQGRISALLTMEEGGILKGSLMNLEKLYRLGVRMIGLSWNHPNEIGFPNLQKDRYGNPLFTMRSDEGLTEFGLEVVREAQRLGMIVDVSHLSDGGFWDVVQHTEQPFVASHSNAQAVCGVCRNLTDEMIRALADKGGVMGINLCEDFLCTENKRGPGMLLDAVIRHICHIIQVGGEDCCGLGSDLDGIEGNRDIRTAGDMVRLSERLEREGFLPRQIDKICKGNVLRVYRDILGT